MGTLRKWWVVVKNVQIGPRCESKNIALLGIGIASKPCIPIMPPNIRDASLAEAARNITKAPTAATYVSRTLDAVIPLATHLLSFWRSSFGPNVRHAWFVVR